MIIVLRSGEIKVFQLIKNPDPPLVKGLNISIEENEKFDPCIIEN